MNIVSRIINGMARRAVAMHQNFSVWAQSCIVHGPNEVQLADDDCAIVSLMKDSEYFLRLFLEHHKALGVRHIVIIDNGSTDRTVDIAREFSGVTVVSNPLPAKQYESKLRMLIGKRIVNGGWLLFVDSDELFDFPLGEERHVGELLRYCNLHDYTAMVTQMLDLYSTAPYSKTRHLDYQSCVTACQTYSLDMIKAIEYHDRDEVEFHRIIQDNICDDPAVRLQIGGMRREFFGEEVFLSKHSLVRNMPGVQTMSHPHCASGVRCADVTGLLRHYKFTGPFIERDRRSVAARTWDHGEDKKRLERVGSADDLTIATRNPRSYAGTKALVDQGFLVCSERYRAFMSNGAEEEMRRD